MKRKLFVNGISVGAVSLMVFIFTSCSSVMERGGSTSSVEPEKIEQWSDTKATQKANGVVRISWLREGVPVQVAGHRLPPAAKDRKNKRHDQQMNALFPVVRRCSQGCWTA